jgi:O-antigen/teichoic acid export membrane protein
LRLKNLVYASSLLVSAQLISLACSFLRNVVVAREISVADFGIAAALAATLAFVEMASAISVDKILLQDPDGESDLMLGAAHFMSILRGLIIGALLYLLAWPITSLFRLHDSLWAFQLLALIPVITSFKHLDYVVMQRNMDLFPAAINASLPQALATLLVFPLVYLFPDYRAVLIIIMVIPLFNVVISHITARRRYQLFGQITVIIKMFRFSWPLMISGLLLFFVFQGEKIIIGTYYDMTMLGLYSVVFTLLILPAMMLHRLCNSIALPIVARSFHDKRSFEATCSYLVTSAILLSAIAFAGFISVGPHLLIFIFGEKFSASLPILPWIALMVCVRILRIAPSVITLAMAKPKCELFANLARLIAIPLCLLAAYLHWPIHAIAAMAFIGEFCALTAAYLFLDIPFNGRHLAVKSVKPSLLFVIFIVTTLALSQSVLFNDKITDGLLATLSALVLFFMLCFSIYNSFPEVKQLIGNLMTRQSAGP